MSLSWLGQSHSTNLIIETTRFQSKYSTSSEKLKVKKDDSKSTEVSHANNSSDKLSALKAYRRANNLCFTCGEKWTGRNNKCPTQIPLHVIQELIEAVQEEAEMDYDSVKEDIKAPAG